MMVDTRTVYESAFGVAINDHPLSLAEARAIARDEVIRTSGRARRTGVSFTSYPLSEWRQVMAQCGIDVPADRPRPPADLEVLEPQYPDGILVLATVEVDPDVTP